MKRKQKSQRHFILPFLLLISTCLFVMSFDGMREDRTNIKAQISSTETINDTSPISQEEKKSLIESAYKELDSYFDKKNQQDIQSNNLPKTLPYQELFITYLLDGKVRCSWGVSPKNTSDMNLRSDILNATARCIQDTRFGGELSEKESKDVTIILTFLYNRRQLIATDLNSLAKNIQLGVHAIEIKNGESQAFFKESVPISSNYNLPKTLERLCLKAKLSETCNTDPNTKIYIYDTYTFLGKRNQNVTELYRYDIPIKINNITNQYLSERISLAGNWFLNNTNNQTHLLEYEYFPSKDMYSSGNNHVRQLGSLWAITELRNFLEKKSFDKIVHRALSYYLAFIREENTFVDGAKDKTIYYFDIENDSKLAYNAFMIYSLLNYDRVEQKEKLLQGLANGIMSLQNSDGSFNTYFHSQSTSGVDFYPGEAMLALMKLYEKNNDERYLKSVQRAFPYYRNYWRNNKNTAFIPWHTQAYSILFKETKNKELADFIFEMNDWLIDNYQVTKNEDHYPDMIGGFPKDFPRSSTSSYLEGINAAYKVAFALGEKKHIVKYRDSIKNGVRFILQTQYTQENSFYLENPTKAIGGFRNSLANNSQRNDYTQHAIFALMGAYKNNIFLNDWQKFEYPFITF